jgi:long-chain acyl-CoA synthetase
MAESVYEIFKSTVEKRGDKVAAQYKVAGAWRDVTWKEMDTISAQCAAALIKHGVEPKDRVNILANTRLEWILADIGILGSGGTTVPIYQSNLAHECQYIIDNSGATFLFAEDDSQLEKLRGIAADIPNIKKIIAFEGTAKGDKEISWEDFLAEGEAYLKDNPDCIKERVSGMTKDQILTLIYTSGTTGMPKGTILTHDAMMYEAEAAEQIDLISGDDVQYLFLPMAHVFAKVLEVIWFKTGHVMAFWERDQKKIVPNMAEVRPTIMAAVPRIYEKVHAKVMGQVEGATGIKGKLGRWAIAKGDEAMKIELNGGTPGGLGWSLAQKLVWSKLSERLNAMFGGRLRFFISGGAPLSKDIAYFFKYAGVMICEGYGLTETAAATTVNLPGKLKIGTVGQPLPGTEVRIAEDGEIMIRGRGVMQGYWKREDATAEVLESDGWFHSGDIGEFDKDGFLRITDRKKDIIVTAGGKNVAPQNIENTLKAKSPLISQVVVHGDKRKYLTAVITVDEEAVMEWAKTKGVGGDYPKVTQSDQMTADIQAVVNDVNGSLASYETLKKFKILDHDFEIGDQLTPSMKVKRKVCNERYKDLFDAMYDG